jgi:hypothetical protein
MTRNRRLWILVAATASIAAVAALLILLSFPIAQEPAGYQLVDGKTYEYESESLFGSASWLNYTYQGVTFGFHLWCLITSAAGEVCGNATESSVVSYPYYFSDGPPQANPSWQTWVAPDQHEAVQYMQGGLVHLLVAQ